MDIFQRETERATGKKKSIFSFSLWLSLQLVSVAGCSYCDLFGCFSFLLLNTFYTMSKWASGLYSIWSISVGPSLGFFGWQNTVLYENKQQWLSISTELGKTESKYGLHDKLEIFGTHEQSQTVFLILFFLRSWECSPSCLAKIKGTRNWFVCIPLKLSALTGRQLTKTSGTFRVLAHL